MTIKNIGMKHIGLDAGSVSVKLVVLDSNGSILSRLYQRHKGQPLPVAFEMLKTVGIRSQKPGVRISRFPSQGPLEDY
jgi:activator of 2-hydroxyglutaryl-CoA dehydratase